MVVQAGMLLGLNILSFVSILLRARLLPCITSRTPVGTWGNVSLASPCVVLRLVPPLEL